MNPRLPRAFATQLLVAALVVLGAGGGLGFAIVDLRHKISVSANTARVLEQRVVETERRIAEVGGAIAAEQSPDVLARRNQALSLGLVPPVVVRDEIESGVLMETHRLPQLKESFYAITPSRRFPNPLVGDLITRMTEKKP